MHESLFWWPTVPSFKRGGFQGSAQEAPKRPQEGPKRFQEASKRWFWEILAFILADVWLFLAMLFNHCLSARDERLGWLRNRLIFHFLFFKCCKKNGGFEGPKSIQNRWKSDKKMYLISQNSIPNPFSINSLRLDSLWIAEALMKVPLPRCFNVLSQNSISNAFFEILSPSTLCGLIPCGSRKRWWRYPPFALISKFYFTILS